MGVLLAAVERSVIETLDVPRIQALRGDGGEHLHWRLLGRTTGALQLRGMVPSHWDDFLPLAHCQGDPGRRAGGGPAVGGVGGWDAVRVSRVALILGVLAWERFCFWLARRQARRLRAPGVGPPVSRDAKSRSRSCGR